MSGRSWTHASAFAKFTPTSSDPARPGPYVTAIPDRSDHSIPASAHASSSTGTIQRRWARAATSGTIPPDAACIATCEATTFETIRRPSAMTAMPVSSHDDSIERISRSRHEAASSGRVGAGASSIANRSRSMRSTIEASDSGSVVMISASSWSSL